MKAAFWFIVIFILLGFSGEAVRADWSAAGGGDRWGGYTEVRYDDKYWGAWLGVNRSSPRVGVEAHRNIGPFLFGIGAALAQPDAVVGSALRYELRVDWNVTDKFSVGWIHESNCRYICSRGALKLLPHAGGNTPNFGYNFIVLRVRW